MFGRKRRPYWQYLQAPSTYWRAPQSVKTLLADDRSTLVPDRLLGLGITEAANIHDWMYVWGSTSVDREDADATLLLNMMRIINEETTTLPILGTMLRRARYNRAITCHRHVRDCGAAEFASNREAARSCAIPPPGWCCTRGAGHTGPCAAVPDWEKSFE